MKPIFPDRFEVRSKRRPVDHWREWAAEPLAQFRIAALPRASRHDPDVFTLEEDGVLIAQWNHDDLPLLYPWLQKWLPRLHGAWHVAQPHLASVKGGATGGKKTGEATTKEAKTRAEKIGRAVKGITRDAPNMPAKALAATLHERGHGGIEALRKKVARKKPKP